MKSTTFVAILLTFLTLLLVLVAAVTFLWQGRQQAAERLTRLQQEKGELQATATIVRSYLSAREEGLATAQAQATVMTAELAVARAAYFDLEGTRMAVEAEREDLSTRVASLEAVFLEPPSVAILAPPPGTALPGISEAGAEIVVAGSHPRGIGSLQLLLGDDAMVFAADGEQFRVFSYTVPALAPGLYTVTATITATNNLTATATSSFRVREPALPQSAGPQSHLFPPLLRDRYPVFFKPAAMPLMVRKTTRNSARASSPS